MKFYLAGPIQAVDDYVSWRKDMEMFLQSNGDEALSPLSKYKGRTGDVKMEMLEYKGRGEIDKVKKTMENFIIPKDIELIDESDALIAYIPTNNIFGTTCEIWETYRQKKKIYVVCTLPVVQWSNWMIGVADHIFKSFRELKKFLKS